MANEMPPHVKAGRLIRLLGWIALLLSLGVPSLIFIDGWIHRFKPPTGLYTLYDVSTPPLRTHPGVITVILFLAFSFIFLAVGKASKEHKNWARTAGIVLGTIVLPVFPIGTVIGPFILWYRIKGWEIVERRNL